MYSPDEIANIRAERNRDVMPSPEEARRERRDYLAREGCVRCGEDDPDQLEARDPPGPDCPRIQSPPKPPIRCDDCQADAPSTAREFAISNAQGHEQRPDQHTVGVVLFECGNFYTVTAALREETSSGDLYEDDYPGYTPEGPLRCACGEPIQEYIPGEEVVSDD